MVLKFPKVALSILIQGLIYCLLGLIIMIHPQAMDTFNFTDKEFAASDYKLAQMISAFVSGIGIIYAQHGIAPIHQYIIPKIVSGYKYTDNTSSVVLFAWISVFNRVIILPIFILIIQYSFGQDNTMIIVFTTILVIMDPIFGIITYFVMRKYATVDSECISTSQEISEI